MKIIKVDPLRLRIPFEDGSSGEGLFPSAWTHLDMVLVRIETDTGLVGWGEAFSYFCASAVASMVTSAYAPLLVGRELADPAALNLELQRRAVLPGRHGITTFALSGVDLALWDLWAKSQDQSLAEVLGRRKREEVPAYASLVRYGDTGAVVTHCRRAVDLGYREIKLHEITLPEIRAARQAVGTEVDLTVDVNCNWEEAFCREVIPELKEMGAAWLEEPVFPPEDWNTLAGLRKGGLPIAAGENACTATPFAAALEAGALDILQPSITKVGGVSEFLRVLALDRNLSIAPHSPYFGPGYLATLQMAALDPRITTFEYLLVEPEGWVYADMPLPVRGRIPIPSGPGLGMDPDPDLFSPYLIS